MAKMGRPKRVEDYGRVVGIRVIDPHFVVLKRIAAERGVTPTTVLRQLSDEWLAGQAGQQNEGATAWLEPEQSPR